MFKCYTLIYYVTSIFGLVPFTYTIQSNEIIFSFTIFKIIYSGIIFGLFAMYVLVATYSKCTDFALSSFLTLITYASYLLGSFSEYFINLYYSKKLIVVLQTLFKMEQKIKSQQRNNFFKIFCILELLMTLVFYSQHIVGKASHYLLSHHCLIIIYMEYIEFMAIFFTCIFILTKLRLFAVELRTCLSNRKNLTYIELKEYVEDLKELKSTYKRVNQIYQIPFTMYIALSFINLLLSFHNFLDGGIFTANLGDLYNKIFELYSSVVWCFQSSVNSIVIIYFVEKCAEEIRNFYDTINSVTEKMDLEYKKVE